MASLQRSPKNDYHATPMELRRRISTESWVEDVQYSLAVFFREEPQPQANRHVEEYLEQRYQPDLVPAAYLSTPNIIEGTFDTLSDG